MNTATRETTITADPAVPTILITREFDAPVDRVFRAHVEPDLVKRWLGPRGLTMEIDHWDARTGGGYRYTHRDDSGEYRFFGSFHEVRPDERIVQTFTYEGFPDGVSLETLTFVDLGDGRTRLEGLSVVDSMAARDAMLSSGMDVGVKEGYEQLDELLAAE
ncbi:SRPBCC family protein [Actinomycetospora lemnae]|uniref:SRPBCC family protein n=1 Tax=Actinomycetospora lemnae TaxID=3019891 RepID=A0ABT5SV62_9PSEU|nr:SRPBCC family protein [Actinomycetospora sp. DW7H6]MDD7965628.1 SRPBCC family protein [Actinomycetospora sp. DW7H6]